MKLKQMVFIQFEEFPRIEHQVNHLGVPYHLLLISTCKILNLNLDEQGLYLRISHLRPFDAR